MKGHLPWQGAKGSTKRKKYDRIGSIKDSIQLADLCSGIPAEFEQYMSYCKNLDFKEDPDYAYLRSLFRRVMIRRGEPLSHRIYDWEALPLREDDIDLDKD